MAIKITNNEGMNDVYHVKCEYCSCEFDYQLEDLGFRPWYPHGFVYCPNCNRPLRHRKENKLEK